MSFFSKFFKSDKDNKQEQQEAVSTVDETVSDAEEASADKPAFDMIAWQERTNELIKMGATALYQMVDGDDWVDAYAQGVPLAEFVECRFYYVTKDGTAYSGQNLANPGVVTDGYIERTMDMAQAVRELYLHFKDANMQPPSSVGIKVTSEGQFNMAFAYDEDTADTDAYFDEFESTQFNNLVK